MYDYSELMIMSRNTLYDYLRLVVRFVLKIKRGDKFDIILSFRAKNRKLKRMSKNRSFKYHTVHHAWNAYLRMVGVDYITHYTCPKCQHEPEVIILNGIAMGRIKNIPQWHEMVNY